jgi:hypothetical protein
VRWPRKLGNEAMPTLGSYSNQSRRSWRRKLGFSRKRCLNIDEKLEVNVKLSN